MELESVGMSFVGSCCVCSKVQAYSERFSNLMDCVLYISNELNDYPAFRMTGKLKRARVQLFFLLVLRFSNAEVIKASGPSTTSHIWKKN